MASQDMLFPILPRNTQVDVKDKNLRVAKTGKTRHSRPLKDDESDNLMQEARIRQKYQPVIAYDQERSKGSLPYAAEQGAVSDPRRQAEDDDDSHKGVNLDTYA